MSLCSPVICPFPNTQPEDNHSTSFPLISGGGNGTLFEQWWSKTNTIPLYLIILLLPLLCFRSASFFARFSFLGEALRTVRGGVRLEWPLVFSATSPLDNLYFVAQDDLLLLLYNSVIQSCGQRNAGIRRITSRKDS